MGPELIMNLYLFEIRNTWEVMDCDIIGDKTSTVYIFHNEK